MVAPGYAEDASGARPGRAAAAVSLRRGAGQGWRARRARRGTPRGVRQHGERAVATSPRSMRGRDQRLQLVRREAVRGRAEFAYELHLLLVRMIVPQLLEGRRAQQDQRVLRPLPAARAVEP